MKKLAAALALMAALLVPATAQAHAILPRDFWQRICENGAKGSVFPDSAALVCAHFDTPWAASSIALLQRVCDEVLGGIPVYRSEYPEELVLCEVGA
jgi:hypothetical protein